jgi:hypothetical protein
VRVVICAKRPRECATRVISPLSVSLWPIPDSLIAARSVTMTHPKAVIHAASHAGCKTRLCSFLWFLNTKRIVIQMVFHYGKTILGRNHVKTFRGKFKRRCPGVSVASKSTIYRLVNETSNKLLYKEEAWANTTYSFRRNFGQYWSKINGSLPDGYPGKPVYQSHLYRQPYNCSVWNHTNLQLC